MTRKRIWVAAATVGVLTLGTGAGVAYATSGDNDNNPISGDALSQASAAALAETGGGRVTETEEGDEDSYYEVEVTKDDGSQVDVQLDQAFHVVSTKTDAEGADDAD